MRVDKRHGGSWGYYSAVYTHTHRGCERETPPTVRLTPAGRDSLPFLVCVPPVNLSNCVHPLGQESREHTTNTTTAIHAARVMEQNRGRTLAQSRDPLIQPTLRRLPITKHTTLSSSPRKRKGGFYISGQLPSSKTFSTDAAFFL